MRYAKIILLILVFFLSMMFFIQNVDILSQTMALKFDLYLRSWKSIALPFYFIILVAFLAGGLFATMYLFLDKLRMAKMLKDAKRQQLVLEKELTSLRNMPLEDKVFSKPALSSSGMSSISSKSHDDEEKTLDPSINGE